MATSKIPNPIVKRSTVTLSSSDIEQQRLIIQESNSSIIYKVQSGICFLTLHNILLGDNFKTMGSDATVLNNIPPSSKTSCVAWAFLPRESDTTLLINIPFTPTSDGTLKSNQVTAAKMSHAINLLIVYPVV